MVSTINLSLLNILETITVEKGNDKYGNRYTIGVLVIPAKKKYKYFAAESAVPTFRQALDILVELEYLKPDGEIIEYNPNRKVHKIDTNIVKTPKIKNKIKKFKRKKTIS